MSFPFLFISSPRLYIRRLSILVRYVSQVYKMEEHVPYRDNVTLTNFLLYFSR